MVDDDDDDSVLKTAMGQQITCSIKLVRWRRYLNSAGESFNQRTQVDSRSASVQQNLVLQPETKWKRVVVNSAALVQRTQFQVWCEAQLYSIQFELNQLNSTQLNFNVWWSVIEQKIQWGNEHFL